MELRHHLPLHDSASLPMELPDLKTDPSFRLFCELASRVVQGASVRARQEPPQQRGSSRQSSTASSSVMASRVTSSDHIANAAQEPRHVEHRSVTSSDDNGATPQIRSASEAGYMTPHTIHSNPHSPSLSDTFRRQQDADGRIGQQQRHGHEPYCCFARGLVTDSAVSDSTAFDDVRPHPHRSDSVSSASSQTTFTSGAADSIFRLLPRETRSALSRMMAVEPSLRCTLGDLLRGRRFSDHDSPLDTNAGHVAKQLDRHAALGHRWCPCPGSR